jgi:hypothetical protein
MTNSTCYTERRKTKRVVRKAPVYPGESLKLNNLKAIKEGASFNVFPLLPFSSLWDMEMQFI